MKPEEIEELISKVVKEEELEEISVSGGVAGINTPFAFGKAKKDSGDPYTEEPPKEKKIFFKMKGNKHQLENVVREMLEKTGNKMMHLYIKPLKEWNEYDYKTFEKIIGKVQLQEVSYREYKNDPSSSPKQKVNNALIEINRKLREVNHILDQNLKLKEELQVDASQYWKRTGYAIQKIAERFELASAKMKGIHEEYTMHQKQLEELTKKERDADILALQAKKKAAQVKQVAIDKKLRRIRTIPTTNESTEQYPKELDFGGIKKGSVLRFKESSNEFKTIDTLNEQQMSDYTKDMQSKGVSVKYDLRKNEYVVTKQ